MSQTKYQQEAEQIRLLSAKAQSFGDDFDSIGNLDSIIDLLKTQKEIIHLLLERLWRYESAQQAFVASIQGGPALPSDEMPS